MFVVITKLQLLQKDDLKMYILQLQYVFVIKTVDRRITVASPQDTPVLQTQHMLYNDVCCMHIVSELNDLCLFGLHRPPSPTRLCPSVALITPQRIRLIMACWITAVFWTLSESSLMSSCCLAPSPSSSSVRCFLRFHQYCYSIIGDTNIVQVHWEKSQDRSYKLCFHKDALK